MSDDKKNFSFIAGRISVNFLLFMLVLLAPWWVYSAIIVFLIFYFNPYYEVIILAFFIDSLYGSPAVLSFPLFFTTSSVILLVASRVLGKRLYR